MIISASRRTDIPAFYSEWLLNRIREGYVMVRNPMNTHSVSRIDLSPEVVDALVLWTKNPERLTPKVHMLEPYIYYFQITITPYGHQLEPNTPKYKKTIEQFQILSRRIGPERMIWRYDPILLTKDIDVGFHKEAFSSLSKALSGYTERCVISFLDLYRKTERNLIGIPLKKITSFDMYELAQMMVAIANKHSMEVVTCAEDIDLLNYGVKKGKCIDDKLISELAGREIYLRKDKTQRVECGCVASIDIGAYNTCPHGCLYCYANFNSNTVKRNLSMHNPLSPLLIGDVKPSDKITVRAMKSCFAVQENIF